MSHKTAGNKSTFCLLLLGAMLTLQSILATHGLLDIIDSVTEQTQFYSVRRNNLYWEWSLKKILLSKATEYNQKFLEVQLPQCNLLLCESCPWPNIWLLPDLRKPGVPILVQLLQLFKLLKLNLLETIWVKWSQLPRRGLHSFGFQHPSLYLFWSSCWISNAQNCDDYNKWWLLLIKMNFASNCPSPWELHRCQPIVNFSLALTDSNSLDTIQEALGTHAKGEKVLSSSSQLSAWESSLLELLRCLGTYRRLLPNQGT